MSLRPAAAMALRFASPAMRSPLMPAPSMRTMFRLATVNATRPAWAPTTRSPGLLLQCRHFGYNGISRTLLASREAAANRNPASATAQNAFYQLLLKANMPAIIIERYQSGRFATNEAGDDAYNRALSLQNQSTTANADLPTHFAAPEAAPVGNLSQAQLQAVGQALAARSKGANVAISKGSGVGTRDGPLHVVVDESLGGIVFRWFNLNQPFL